MEQCVGVRSHLEKWGLVKSGDEAPAGGAEARQPYGSPSAGESFVAVSALLANRDRRPYDKGFYRMLLDSKEAGEKIVTVGRDIFRPDQRRPYTDEITVDDTALMVRLIQRS